MPGNYSGTGCGYDGCGYGIGVPMPSSAATLLLDNLPQFRIAVATKKLRTDYTGNCLQVRRSSDSTTANYGFVNGVVDSASYDTFCGAGNGFVAAWYDQSGSGNNLTNAVTTSQPRVVASGVVEEANGNVSIRGVSESLLDSPTLTRTSPYHQFFVVHFPSTFSTQFIADGHTTNTASLAWLANAQLRFWTGQGVSDDDSSSLVNRVAIIETLNKTGSGANGCKLRINERSYATTASATGSTPTRQRLFTAGATGLGFPFVGWISAFLEYDGELTTEQVTAVRDGLNELYGVF